MPPGDPSSCFGDHPGGSGEWLDRATETEVLCPACERATALRRFRAVYGAGKPLHLHEIVACPMCDRWSVVCYPAVPQPDVGSGVASTDGD